MSEKDYAPLTIACVRALQDKVYDKRKTAALEIEKMVREFATANKADQVRRVLNVLGREFCGSQNPHARKGGLIGLASAALALGKDASLYTNELINPVIACLSDSDVQIRFYATESMYNVIKVTRSAVLPQFHGIFGALSKLAADPEQRVKSASELVDRLMKDIVTECPKFDLVAFIPLLRERLSATNSFARHFIISWISTLHAVPDIDLIPYLPDILDGMFQMLDDHRIEIKKSCETCLGEFLRSIKGEPSRVDFAGMINILITHAQSNDETVQYTAIVWIKEFVQLSGPLMLPSMSGIFTAVLPCLSYDSEARRRTDIKETATAVNFTLMKLITLQLDQEENTTLQYNESGDNERTVPNKLDLPSVLKVLTDHLFHNSVQTKVAVLRWIHHLYTNVPNRTFGHIEELYPSLMKTLSDPADEVVQQCLIVFAEIISSPAGHQPTSEINSSVVTSTTGDDRERLPPRQMSRRTSPYYSRFVISLLRLFNMEKHFLEDRGSFIIRQLCVLLNAEDIYRTLAEILLTESNPKFASLMVRTLNMILLTSSELFELRNELKDMKTERSCSLFCCLYETWCHNPVATVALCLLTQSYTHACDLIRTFGNIEVTVEFLTEIDKLVQLIESPIFVYLRLELLEVPCDQHLVKALYGLLMLLPQTEAFQTLKTRLSCIPSLHLGYDTRNVPFSSEMKAGQIRNINFQKLLNHFIRVQEKHNAHKKAARMRNVSSLEHGLSNTEI